MFHWTTALMGFGDPDVSGEFDDIVKVSFELAAYGVALAEARREHPSDDLTTSLVRAEVDGQRLTSDEIASFFILLTAAGNETTRNAIRHGMVALSPLPRRAAEMVGGLRRARTHRGGVNRAVGIAHYLHASHPHRGH